MKFRGNPKKYLPALGFLPTAVLAVCIAVSLGDYTAPVLSLDAVGESAEKSTETSTTEKRRERKTAAVTTKAPAPAVEKLSESGTYKDGTYTGTGTGFSGPITVQVVIEDGKIKDITILSATDDSPYLQNASALLKQIVALQSTNVDTVSGATYSSVGLISAVRDALQKAGGSSASDSALPTLAAAKSQSNEEPPTVETVEEPAAYRDGVYTGTGTGFGGEMTVQVTVSGGRITDIQILSSKDDSPYLQNASALLQNIIAAQSTNVDAVSGATFSSTGLIEAVRNALANAATGSAETTPAAVTEKKPEQTTAPAKPGKKGAFPYPDGVYTGSGEGYGGITKIELTLKDGTIEKIHVVSNEDDESFFKRAETLISLVIQRQSTDVDVVSGATFSSDGILEAINEALDAAKNAAQPAVTTTTTVTTIAPPENTTAAPVTGTTSTETTTEPIEKIYDDGTYVGTADCYPDEDEDFVEYVLSVKVKIENDRIVSISDASGAGDSYDKLNDRYISRAAKGTGKITGTIAQILEKQHTDGIDAVSGATCSSDAIVRAVDDALAQARKGA